MKPLLLVFMGFSVVAQAHDLGRLFFTPEERAMLDRLRQPGQIAPKGGGPEGATGSVEVKGGGKTVWTDGVPRRIVPGGKK